jgi:hypothetical protein
VAEVEDQSAETGEAASTYTAVIHVHGMGSQRRFEETATLIDSLDRYVHKARRAAGALLRIAARSEKSRADPERTVSYIRTVWAEKLPDGDQAYSQVRFYEVYWAPVMAGQQSPWRILRWIFSQVWRPWLTGWSPWRERQRLRRSALAQLFQPGMPRPAQAQDNDFHKLVELYDDYEGLPAQRAHGRGGFKEFLLFIESRFKSRPETVRRLQGLAHLWRRHYRRNELRAAFVLTTIALALLLAAGGTIAAVLMVLRWVASANWQFPDEVAAWLKADWKTAAGLASSLFLFLGLGKFLTDYMGDVEAWSTYRETDEKHERRQKVLDRATEAFSHVLADPRCTRVVVTSHSLGTTIANETLLALARNNRASNAQDPLTGPVRLDKIEHLVTMGSPIDKIEYFFESYSSRSHRYKRTVEELRGDIGREPFSRNRKPYIHWINFWDEGDVISGSLQSPLNRERVDHRVDNVHVRHFRFPAPGASHLAYLDSHKVVSTLFDIIYCRASSFRTLPVVPGRGPDYDSVALGPGEPRGDRRIFHFAALALPWFAAIAAAFYVYGVRGSVWPYLPAGLALLLLVGGYAWSRLSGHRDPV